MRNLIKGITLVALAFVAFSCSTDSEEKNLKSVTIIDIAKATPELSTFVEAVELAGLTEELDKPGNLTVFVPNNDAFDILAANLGITDLSQVDPVLLADVLKYHVLGARVSSSDLSDGQEAATLQGQNITVTLSPNAFYPEYDTDLGDFEETSVFINSARVFARDVKCSNGIIHVIDAVLLPSS
ncbi:MAG: fasciclin domain-containing protein [Flavobacterium sp.]|uniref:fasciclin domain-containing protein n=1 Tax=Flavobacterium sp. TaxID=239 RepID=UPI003BDCE4EE